MKQFTGFDKEGVRYDTQAECIEEAISLLPICNVFELSRTSKRGSVFYMFSPDSKNLNDFIFYYQKRNDEYIVTPFKNGFIIRVINY